jgi:hypothetical protein
MLSIEIEKDGNVLGRYMDLLVREEATKPWYVVLSDGAIPRESDFYLPPKGEFILTNASDSYDCSLERFKRVMKLDRVALVGTGTCHIDRPVEMRMRVDNSICIIHYLIYVNVGGPSTKEICEKKVSAIGGKYTAIEDRGGVFDVFDDLISDVLILDGLSSIGEMIGDVF